MRTLVAACALAVAVAAFAEDPPRSHHQAAVEVAAAVREGDDAKLRALAALAAPDPWRVADTLCAAGNAAAASAFARAAASPDTEKLAAYIDARGDPDADAALRTTVSRVSDAIDERRFEDALRAAEPPPGDDVTIVRVRLLLGRGIALDGLGRWKEAVAVLAQTEDAALRIGWFARARDALRRAAYIAYFHVGARAAEVLAGRWRDQAARGGDAMAAADAVILIGAARERLGDLRGAVGALEEAVRRMHDVGSAEGASRAYGNLGDVLRWRGDLARALGCLESAVRSAEKAGLENDAALWLGNLAVLHEDLGDRARARAIQDDVLRRMRAQGDEVGAARALANIGGLDQAEGDHRAALGRLDEARRIFAKAGDEATATAVAVILATAHEGLGERERAIRMLEEAHARLVELGDHATAVATLKDLAGVRFRAGDADRARTHWIEARARAAELESRDVEVACLAGLAQCDRATGRPRDALRAAREAVLALPRLVAGAGEDQAGAARGVYAEIFAEGTLAARDAGDAATAAWFLESGRAGALLEAFRLRSALLSDTVPPDLCAAESEARFAESVAADAFRSATAGGDLAATRTARAELDAARARRLDAVARIQRTAKLAASVTYPVADDAAALASRLAADEALVLYGMFDGGSVAVVVTPQATRIVDLGPTDALRAAAAAFRPERSDTDPAPALDALRRCAADPLALPPSVRRVLVSPDAELSLLPLALLFPDRDVVCVPSGTVLGLLEDDRARRGTGVLALGDPDYGVQPARGLAASDGVSRSGMDLVPLGVAT